MNLLSYFSILLFGGILLPGCIILPLPHTRDYNIDVKGRVFSAVDDSPVINALLLDIEYEDQTVATNSEGRFEMPSASVFHWGYQGGVISHSIWPHVRCIRARYRFLKISAEGFKSKVILVSTEESYVRDEWKYNVELRNQADEAFLYSTHANLDIRLQPQED